MFDKCFKGLLTFVDKTIQIGQGLKTNFVCHAVHLRIILAACPILLSCLILRWMDWCSTNMVSEYEHLRIKKCMKTRGQIYMYIRVYKYIYM